MQQQYAKRNGLEEIIKIFEGCGYIVRSDTFKQGGMPLSRLIFRNEESTKRRFMWFKRKILSRTLCVGRLSFNRLEGDNESNGYWELELYEENQDLAGLTEHLAEQFQAELCVTYPN